jgi:GNAT superfamily N-acetyltransferase
VIITAELARRLEIAEALDGVDCAEASCRLQPESGSSVHAVAGGFCLFCGESSPLTHALGIGLHGPVSKEEVLEMEDFFRSRGAGVIVDITPYTDPAVRELLGERGYHITDMNTVLVRAVRADEELPGNAAGITVRTALSSESELYGKTVICGFLSRDELTEDEVILGQTLFHMPNAMALFALAGEEAAGGCGMSARNGVASFFGDATLPRFRGRGVHAAMILERLRRAQSAGCDLATAGTQPGSTSQRNYQRLGFEVAYSKITMTRGM